MPANDRILLDSVLAKATAAYGSNRTPGEYFELFVFDHILRDNLLSLDELESGWVDGPQDGGIDGVFIFLDGRHVTEPFGADDVGRNPTFSLHIITARHKDAFQEAPLNALNVSLPMWFDLERGSDTLESIFGEEVLRVRDIFRETLVGIADRHPRLTITITYASRGDTGGINKVVLSRMEQLQDSLRSLFSQVVVHGRFFGAAELLELSRRQRTSQRRIRVSDVLDPRDGKTFVLLVRVLDYFDFITGDDSSLARSLFEANVRDYVGDTRINKEIRETLLDTSSDRPEFWWLNNGVTMLASNVTPLGKELVLENPLVVNGLQTSQVIYNVYSAQPELRVAENRTMLVKVIVAPNDEVRDRIIKATNFQNPVALASLRATDRVQRDIEHYLADRGWYYDRRPGYHRNVGRPPDRIISTSFLGSAVWALAHQEMGYFDQTRWMRNDSSYQQVFNADFPLEMYVKCIEIIKAVSHDMRMRSHAKRVDRAPREGETLFALLVVCHRLNWRRYTVRELAGVSSEQPSDDEWYEIQTWVERIAAGIIAKATAKGYMPTLSNLLGQKKFVNQCVNAVKERLKSA